MTRASRICRICDRPGLPDHPVQEYEYPQYCRGIDADCLPIGYKIQLDRADEYELKLDSLRENLERQVELQRARAEKAEWERDEARETIASRAFGQTRAEQELAAIRVEALRYFAQVQDCVCDNSEWESGICCHKQARAALAAA